MTITGAEHVSWDLSDLGPAGAETDLAARARCFRTRYEGRIAGIDGGELGTAFHELDGILRSAARSWFAPYLRTATDCSDPVDAARLQQVQLRTAAVQQELMFFIAECSALDRSRRAQLHSESALAPYRHALDTLWRGMDNRLSDAEETVISEKSVTGIAAWTRLYSTLVSRLRIRLDGAEVSLEAALSRLEQSDLRLRRRAAGAISRGLKSDVDTRAFAIDSVVLDRLNETQLRARSAAGPADDHRGHAVMAAVTSRYEICRRYYSLKARLIGVRRIRFDGDRLAPISTDSRIVTWQQARAAVLEAQASCSPRFARIATDFFDRRWIDARMSPHKLPHAFTSCVPGVHPYVLLSYNGSLRSVLTLAHELGHGIHGVLAGEQPLLYAQVPLELTEAASLFSEQLTFRHLMAAEANPESRLELLMVLLDSAVNMVFRHVAITRFEDSLRERRGAGEELTEALISELWMRAHHEMLGDSVELPKGYRWWWSCLPHLVGPPGHEQLHACGYLIAHALYRRYAAEGDAMTEPFIRMLEAGGSDTPERLAALAGLTLGDDRFWAAEVDALDSVVAEAEALARDAGR